MRTELYTLYQFGISLEDVSVTKICEPLFLC
jgi:hypothetical protein